MNPLSDALLILHVSRLSTELSLVCTTVQPLIDSDKTCNRSRSVFMSLVIELLSSGFELDPSGAHTSMTHSLQIGGSLKNLLLKYLSLCLSTLSIGGSARNIANLGN